MQPLALAMIFGAVPLDGRSDVLSGRRSAWSLLVLYGRRLWRWSSTDAQVAAYGRFEGVPSRADLERFFFLDDADKSLIGDRRGDHNRLGLMLQATTVRFVGLLLEDPLEVPWPVVEYLAGQLEIDASCVKRYTERPKTVYEHAWEIRPTGSGCC